jgi:hypothetical protein
MVTRTVHGELVFFYAPTDGAQRGNGFGGDPAAQSELICRMVAWLPHGRAEDTPQDVPPWGSLPDPDAPDLEEIRIGDLRAAIRANRVSFPSQVPTFTRHHQSDLQRKLVQLYFVSGWNAIDIGRRYELTTTRVQQILNMWRHRAVKAGYIQHIPPAGTMVQQPVATVVAAGDEPIALRNTIGQMQSAPRPTTGTCHNQLSHNRPIPQPTNRTARPGISGCSEEWAGKHLAVFH